MHQDKKRTTANAKIRKNVKESMKSVTSTKATKTSKTDLLAKAYATIDKAKKRGVIHRNKASRLKSRIAKRSTK